MRKHKSNTKLTDPQKLELQNLRDEAKETGVMVFHFPQYGVCVALLSMGKGYRVATAVASPDEKKYRKKVGEYYALTRLIGWGEFTFVGLKQEPLEVWAEGFASYASFSEWHENRDENGNPY